MPPLPQAEQALVTPQPLLIGHVLQTWWSSLNLPQFISFAILRPKTGHGMFNAMCQ